LGHAEEPALGRVAAEGAQPVELDLLADVTFDEALALDPTP